MSLGMLRLVTLAMGAGAALIVAYYFASLELREASRRGLRGLARVRALRSMPILALAEPFLAWGGARAHGVLGVRTLERLDQKMIQAGEPLGLDGGELVALCGLGAVVGFSLGMLHAILGGGSPIFVPLLACLFGVLPWVRVESLAQERGRAIDFSLLAAVDLICLSLGAGLDFPSAIRQVVERTANPKNPLIGELKAVLQELSLGRTRRQALQSLLERHPRQSIREFVQTATQAEEEGQPLVEVLASQALVQRQRRAVRAEEAASKAAAQLVGPMSLLFCSVFLLIAGPLCLGLMGAF